MLYYFPHIKLKMDIDDVPDGGQPMSAGKKPLAKRKPKVLPQLDTKIYRGGHKHAVH
jgi:hypothetical protein